MSGRSSVSKQSTNATSHGFGTDGNASAYGPYHEGWLSKRTSGKVARWQRRYFTLNGCVLRYHHKPGAPAKRTFDIRRAKRISIAADQARELELDFGFRVWRLRAETPESARRWQLLDTGRLVVGADVDIGDCDDDWSDNDSSSSCSTVRSTSSLLSADQAPQTLIRANTGEQTRKEPPIVERIEVDPDDLDQKFRAWLPCSAFDGEESGVSVETSQQQPIRIGLQNALAGLWTAFGASSESAHQKGPHAALLALHSRPAKQDPEALECVLGEYLSRIHKSLVRWVEHCDPFADEVTDTVQWLLFEMQPSLERFEAGLTKLAAKEVTGWRGAAVGLQSFMLGEWETRSCDEVFRRCGAIYCNAGRGVHSERKLEEDSRSGTVLDILRNALQQWSAWKCHGCL